MLRISFIEKLTMLSFLMDNLNNVDKLIDEYKREPEKWDALKASFPSYREYIAKYPDIIKRMKEAGITL